MLRSVLAIVAGYVAACLAAGATQVLFVLDPDGVFATREAALAAVLLVAMAATQAATFAFPFAVIAIGLTEAFGFRGWLTYAVTGIVIALCGYWTVLAGEPPGATLGNTVALRAFAASGVVAGLVYWAVAGRRRFESSV
jgi:hypothetical protein